MALIRTVKFKLPDLDKDEYIPLIQECSSLYNKYTDWAYKVKSYNKNKCHKETYSKLKDEHPNIKIALLQSVRDIALESVKRGKFKTKRPIAKKFQSLRLQRNYSYTLRGKLLSVIGRKKRNKVLLHVPEKFEKYFNGDVWKNKSASLCYDRSRKEFWIHIVFESKQDIIKPDTENVLGIDRGIYNLVTDSNGNQIKSNHVRKIKRKYLYNKKKLQQKGTRSAKRKLKNLSGREKRFMKDFNHKVSKKVSNYDYNTFVLENLSGILKNKRGKKLNKWLRDWSFYQFQTFLEYKCQALGKKVIYVDPRYTSQKCNQCGKIDKSNRNKSKYKCSCGYRCHSDHNAAKNIRDIHILSSTKSEDQAVVNQPIESGINS